MTRRPRQLRNRNDMTTYRITQLICGFDFFGLAFGEGPEAIAAMKEAWEKEEVRQAVYDRLASRGSDRVPWIQELIEEEQDNKSKND